VPGDDDHQVGLINETVCQLSQRSADEGIAEMRQGLADYAATGAHLARPYFLAILAEALQNLGRVDDGLAVVSEAIEAGSGNGYYDAELYRLKGELTLKKHSASARAARPKRRGTTPLADADAEEHLRKAMAIARRQRAKSLELRATMSLARLWQQQGKHAQARQELAAIYGWFTEGFETRDLRAAIALLDELA